MFRLTDVVKNLILLNVVVYLVGILVLPKVGLGPQFLFMYDPFEPLSGFQAYQIVSHMFMHDPGGFSHILFNMLTLAFLGPMVETNLGPKRFLILYLASGFGAMITHFLISPNPVVGASGAVYGVLIAFAVLYPNIKLMLLFPPIPIKAKYLAIILMVIGLVSGVGGYQQGIAHFAHLGGALTAFLILLGWKKVNFKQ